MAIYLPGDIGFNLLVLICWFCISRVLYVLMAQNAMMVTPAAEKAVVLGRMLSAA